jgi:T5SS/PEP-CTERM-associated repeat protein
MKLTKSIRLSLSLVVTLGAILWLSPAARAENNTTTIIDGTNYNNNGTVYWVGQSGTGNSLTITNGGVLTNVDRGFIGQDIGANSNTATVTGSNSVWNNSDLLAVGWQGSGNTLTIAAGGAVFNTDGYIGNAGTNNAVAVPEPSSFALLAIGGLVLGGYAWRKKQQQTT